MTDMTDLFTHCQIFIEMNEEIDTALLFCVWLTVWRFPRGRPGPPRRTPPRLCQESPWPKTRAFL